jgi:hypothetical protein
MLLDSPLRSQTYILSRPQKMQQLGAALKLAQAVFFIRPRRPTQLHPSIV